jgi:hypothetical protein
MKFLIRRSVIAGAAISLSCFTYAAVGASSSGGAASSNGTNGTTNPSSVGSSTTSPEKLGGGVGTGTTSKADTGMKANTDYQNAVRVYGANSPQAKSALSQRSRSTSRATGVTSTGQTNADQAGTFAPGLNSGSGASGNTSGVSTGAGMATGTGAGTAASTNGSPTAH